MGEVHSAAGLSPGQSAISKFLLEKAARNLRLLERLHAEVRVADGKARLLTIVPAAFRRNPGSRGEIGLEPAETG